MQEACNYSGWVPLLVAAEPQGAWRRTQCCNAPSLPGRNLSCTCFSPLQAGQLSLIAIWRPCWITAHRWSSKPIPRTPLTLNALGSVLGVRTDETHTIQIPFLWQDSTQLHPTLKLVPVSLTGLSKSLPSQLSGATGKGSPSPPWHWGRDRMPEATSLSLKRFALRVQWFFSKGQRAGSSLAPGSPVLGAKDLKPQKDLNKIAIREDKG